MTHLTLVPAYGRDYKSKKEVEQAWTSGKDFEIVDITHPDSGRYCSIRDFENEPRGFTVNIRYKRLTQICVLPKGGKW